MSSTDEDYSENEDTGEIKLKHTVLNTDYLDSDESEESDQSDEIVFSRDRLQSADENTEENSLVLGELLSEVATAEAIGKNNIRIELYNKRNKFLKKNEDIDFDTNEHGYPFIPAECEEYLLPFLQKMKELRPQLKGTKIETNVKNLTFKF